jgi:transposase
MSTPRRRFSREFKLEAVRRVQETGRTQAQVADELGISANTLCRWMKQYRADKAEPFPGKGSQTSQAALISRLRRENERLRKERDFLKKTAKYFAAKSESDTE